MMIIATTETVVGQRIVATLSHVFGLAVRTRGIAGNIMAGLSRRSTLDEDAMGAYVATLVAARDAAIAQMAANAKARGANAVIDLRFESAPVGHGMSESVAYGTAVILEPAPDGWGDAVAADIKRSRLEQVHERSEG
jgi:uncharacterized protein YbjQ (UPF0145 family)